jgi:flagellar basal-body rod protein FlgC
MSVNGVQRANPIDIAVSGLRAQSLRMNVISGNIANSGATRTEDGTPYRRQDVLLTTNPDALGGVDTMEVVTDSSSVGKRIYDPSNPNADSGGFVQASNVELPAEMMNLVTASRAYQANAAVLKRYQELSDVTLELLR